MSAESYVGWYGKQRRQDWGTPIDLFDRLHAEYCFDLDGAADGNALLPDASTPDAPVSWAGRRVFCNPPWSTIPPFVEQAAEAEIAVLLVPARTNSRWFHRALELGATVRYFPKRPSFRNGQHAGPGHNSPVDCVLLVFGETPDCVCGRTWPHSYALHVPEFAALKRRRIASSADTGHPQFKADHR